MSKYYQQPIHLEIQMAKKKKEKIFQYTSKQINKNKTKKTIYLSQ